VSFRETDVVGIVPGGDRERRVEKRRVVRCKREEVSVWIVPVAFKQYQVTAYPLVNLQERISLPWITHKKKEGKKKTKGGSWQERGLQ
jgi:CRISPR/Cas system-associated protein Cas5 (RAMP superfamily)